MALVGTMAKSVACLATLGGVGAVLWAARPTEKTAGDIADHLVDGTGFPFRSGGWDTDDSQTLDIPAEAQTLVSDPVRIGDYYLTDKDGKQIYAHEAKRGVEFLRRADTNDDDVATKAEIATFIAKHWDTNDDNKISRSEYRSGAGRDISVSD